MSQILISTTDAQTILESLEEISNSTALNAKQIRLRVQLKQELTARNELNRVLDGNLASLESAS